MSKLYFIPIIALYVTFSSCSSSKHLIIEEFKTVNYLSDSVWGFDKQKEFYRYYLVSNFKNNKECRDSLDKFVCSYFWSTTKSYSKNSITFYKKTKITNEEMIRKNPRNIDRNSGDDIIYTYTLGAREIDNSLRITREVSMAIENYYYGKEENKYRHDYSRYFYSQKKYNRYIQKKKLDDDSYKYENECLKNLIKSF